MLQADGAIRTLLYHDLGDTLIVVTESLVVGQFRVETDGSLVEVILACDWLLPEYLAVIGCYQYTDM